ncbi:MAG: amidohydrolase family protein [Spirochaetes bacterium]|nr:amidohydrolase family protein [Spirochaetota bacterium]
MADYLIKDALIVDGTGGKPFTGSVTLTGGRIDRIIKKNGRSGGAPRAKKTINASGLALSPGFIDIHSHCDWLLPDPNNAEVLAPLMLQGVTTVVTGQCGSSPAPVFRDNTGTLDFVSDVLCDNPISFDNPTLGSFFTALEKNGIAMNMAHFIGHGTLNLTMKGEAYRRRFTPAELVRMAASIDESFDSGAFGLSFGLGYPPGIFSGLEELEWFAGFAGRRKAVVSVHLKSLGAISPAYPFIPGGTPHNLMALREMVDVAKKSGAALQVSHLIFTGKPSWKTADAMIGAIEKESASGLDIAFDAFPYTAGNTAMVALIPSWFFKNFDRNIKSRLMIARFRAMWKIANMIMGFDVYGDTIVLKANYEPFEKYDGMTFSAIAAAEGITTFDAFLLLAEKTKAMTRVLIPGYYDNEGPDGIMTRVLNHPLCRFETDAIITRKGFQNPATYGNFPKILGGISRDMGLMPLEEAVRKMTGASASRLGIKKRGEIREGYYADLVLFDPQKINENPEPNKPALGIKHVFINGGHAVDSGRLDRKKTHGRVLRKNE